MVPVLVKPPNCKLKVFAKKLALLLRVLAVNAVVSPACHMALLLLVAAALAALSVNALLDNIFALAPELLRVVILPFKVKSPADCSAPVLVKLVPKVIVPV